MTTLIRLVLFYTWICLLSTAFNQVSSTECYICHSKASWEDCHKDLRRTDCSEVAPGYDTCVKQYIIKGGANNTRMMDYVKRCGASNECDVIKEGCKARGYYCEADCCHSNLCNSSGKPVSAISLVSGISYVTCALSCLYLRLCYV